MLWPNEILQHLKLRLISDGYPILHSTPGLECVYSSNIHVWCDKSEGRAGFMNFIPGMSILIWIIHNLSLYHVRYIHSVPESEATENL